MSSSNPLLDAIRLRSAGLLVRCPQDLRVLFSKWINPLHQRPSESPNLCTLRCTTPWIFVCSLGSVACSWAHPSRNTWARPAPATNNELVTNQTRALTRVQICGVHCVNPCRHMCARILMTKSKPARATTLGSPHGVAPGGRLCKKHALA